MDFQDGEILYIDKPYRFTSFDVVNKVRWQLCRALGVKKLKVGHAGTLDPLATGVMIVCTGRATKRIEEFQAHTKEYVATLRLGATTPSYDLEKPIDAYFPTEHITRAMVEEVLSRFVGTIEQIPPSFSACKVGGVRAYDMARKGRDVELKPKTLVIDEIELLDCSLPDITIRVVCSKGTYIRLYHKPSEGYERRYPTRDCRGAQRLQAHPSTRAERQLAHPEANEPQVHARVVSGAR